MTERGRARTTAQRALWCFGLFVLLAGIFGMHGLSSHAGGVGGEVHTMASREHAAATALAAMLGGHDGESAGVRGAADGMARVGSVVDQLPPVGDMGLTAMCLAVLAVALAMLLRILGDVPALRLRRRVRTSTRVAVSPGRDPDPPSLIVLSIQRC